MNVRAYVNGVEVEVRSYFKSETGLDCCTVRLKDQPGARCYLPVLQSFIEIRRE